MVVVCLETCLKHENVLNCMKKQMRTMEVNIGKTNSEFCFGSVFKIVFKKFIEEIS